MLEARKQAGLETTKWQTSEDVMDWWLSGKVKKEQEETLLEA